MLPDPTLLVQQITELQHDAVARWHTSELDNPHDGLLATVCQQHQFNFLLWHEEDIARSPDVSNARIAAVPFYQSMGWKIVSELFDIPTAGMHHRMIKRMPE